VVMGQRKGEEVERWRGGEVKRRGLRV